MSIAGVLALSSSAQRSSHLLWTGIYLSRILFLSIQAYIKLINKDNNSTTATSPRARISDMNAQSIIARYIKTSAHNRPTCNWLRGVSSFYNKCFFLKNTFLFRFKTTKYNTFLKEFSALLIFLFLSSVSFRLVI